MIRFMNALRARILLCFALLLLAAAPLAAQTATPGPIPEPREIYVALAFGDPVFPPADWLASAAERADRTTATWVANEYGALGHAEYLHFGGGYEAGQLDQFFDEGWFAVTLKDYDEWEQSAACTAGGMLLHEFQLVINDQPYLMRYWIQPVSPTRILTMQIVFPASQTNLLDRYSQLFAPLAWRCPA